MNTNKNSGRMSGNGMLGRIAALAVLALASVASADDMQLAMVATETAYPELTRSYGSPREICRMVEKRVSYKTEKEDKWSPAAETLAAGRGDCEDFAIVIQDVCKANGMDAKVHLYFPSKGGAEGHAVLVGEWNGKMWFSSNGSYEEVRSEDEVKARVASMLSCKAKNLWGMKLDERSVARYIAKTPARSVAAR